MPDSQEFQSLLQDFRKLFNDKSKKALQKAFVQLGSVVYSSGGSIKLSFNLMEFKIALYKNYKHMFNFEQIKRIFLLLDANGNGRIEFDEFADGIRGKLSEHRQQIVNFIFYRLDKNMSGYIEESELSSFFQNSLLPEILSRQEKPTAKSAEFIKNYGTPGSGLSGGRISLQQFTDYYITKSLKTESDRKFKADCMDEWLFKDEDVNAFIRQSTISREAVTNMPHTPPPSMLPAIMAMTPDNSDQLQAQAQAQAQLQSQSQPQLKERSSSVSPRADAVAYSEAQAQGVNSPSSSFTARPPMSSPPSTRRNATANRRGSDDGSITSEAASEVSERYVPGSAEGSETSRGRKSKTRQSGSAKKILASFNAAAAIDEGSYSGGGGDMASPRRRSDETTDTTVQDFISQQQGQRTGPVLSSSVSVNGSGGSGNSGSGSQLYTPPSGKMNAGGGRQASLGYSASDRTVKADYSLTSGIGGSRLMDQQTDMQQQQQQFRSPEMTNNGYGGGQNGGGGSGGGSYPTMPTNPTNEIIKSSLAALVSALRMKAAEQENTIQQQREKLEQQQRFIDDLTRNQETR